MSEGEPTRPGRPPADRQAMFVIANDFMPGQTPAPSDGIVLLVLVLAASLVGRPLVRRRAP